MKFIYKILEKDFIKYLLKKNGSKITKDNLLYSFTDLNGYNYYSFPKETAIPIVRLGKLQEFYTWLSAGLTGSELESMVDYADKALSNGLKDGKGMAKIGFILSEIRERKNMVVHPEIYYNILAAQLIRHDEDINDWNNEIHLQKVESFKELDKVSDTFFLLTHKLLAQFDLSSITKKQLHDLFEKASIKIQAMKEMLARE